MTPTNKRYFVIRNANKKVVEFYDMKESGPMTTNVSRNILKQHLKQGQTFHEESKCPVRVKKINVLAQAVSLETAAAPVKAAKSTIGY